METSAKKKKGFFRQRGQHRLPFGSDRAISQASPEDLAGCLQRLPNDRVIRCTEASGRIMMASSAHEARFGALTSQSE
jgi:hypothetical protein